MNTRRTSKAIFIAVGIIGILLLIWFYLGSKGQSPIPSLKTVPLGKSIVAPKMVGSWGRIIIVAADGTLWGWGDSMQGELGIRTNEVCAPRQISGVPCWKEAATGSGFAIALKNDGTLWAWGADNFAAKNSADPSRPVRVGGDTNWIHVAAGASHYLAQKVDGTLWTWGANNLGQLGNGGTTESKDPIQIGSGPWTTFAAGAFHGAAIAPDGTLWDWGRHASGGGTALSQVGDETNWVVVSSGEFHTIAKKSDGSWWIWGDNTAFMQAGAATFPAKIQGTESWVSVAGGNTHTLALGNNGSLWGIGYNFQGEIGDGTRSEHKLPVQVESSTNWIAIAALGATSAGITGDGTVFVWGVRADIPPRTGYGANVLRTLSRFLQGLNGRPPSGTTKKYSSSTKPVAIMQFQRVGISDTNSPSLRSNSAALPSSSKQ